MTDAPERIWTCTHVGEYGHYFPDAVEAEGEYGGTAVEYLRSDIAKPRVKPLVWENDTAWVDIGAKFKGSYSITQLEYDLAEVSFGVLCHEFGDEVIWRGPKEEAKAHANAHNEARVLACLEGYGDE